MRKVFPFLLVGASLFAVLGVLFLLIRTDALPARVRSLRSRTGTTPEASPAEEAIA